MADSTLSSRNTWGGISRDQGLKLVVALVDDAVGRLLHEAAGCGSTSDWGDGRRVHEPDRGGIARLLTTHIYQDLLAFASDLMILDPAVADEEAWEVLCEYFSGCGAAQERLLLLRPLELPAGVPEANVTVITAPEKLTVGFLRQQITDAEAS